MAQPPERKRTTLKAAVAVLLIGGAIAFLAAGGHRLLDWQTLSGYRDTWQGWIAEHPLTGALAFFGIYVGVTALSIPGAVALTLIGGSLFGLVQGTVLVSTASVLGATLAMLVARYLLRNFTETRLGSTMNKLNQGVERNGARYLFGLRLLPIIPFFLINLGMGLTRMQAWTFAWVSMLGMLPATIIYVNAGSQFASIERASDLLNWRILLALVALAALPFAAKAARGLWERRAPHAQRLRPKSPGSWPNA
ncbi:TVP38/TMEM64 family protein [Microvirga aerilata]|uniref:TVP38/TMEM64 family membrane protein n=1 Tax=Microvirga aerilata TaxID=670292 RepID=A0A936ZIN5_9HYPH|nr:TVP38/TMEM64 family protein [Microvirga aerilata]MBL0407907.1 TVP38/TMEM64 family protein [Microvirga aerilata]